MSLLLSNGGGGVSIDVGLLGENHHKISLVVGEDLQSSNYLGGYWET
jgi:hypothetical protein